MQRVLLTALIGSTLAGCSCATQTTGPGGTDSGSVARDTSLAVLDTGPPPPPVDVHVRLTGDNAYGFGYGTDSSLLNYFLGREDGSNLIFDCSEACTPGQPCSTGTCDTFGTCNDDRLGPETYIVPGADAQEGNYLYIIAWSDESVTQGVLGRFETADGSGRRIVTGTADWEVCATGMDYDPGSGGPTREVIDAQLAACAAGQGPSAGWVGTTPRNNHAVAIGEANDAAPGGAFPPTCTDSTKGDSVPSDAKWMWYDWDTNDPADPFRSDGDPHGEFYIFRLSLAEILG
jgi:hypothetical protein